MNTELTFADIRPGDKLIKRSLIITIAAVHENCASLVEVWMTKIFDLSGWSKL